MLVYEGCVENSFKQKYLNKHSLHIKVINTLKIIRYDDKTHKSWVCCQNFQGKYMWGILCVSQ